ncbi:MAG TPA: hypothetical protein VFO18_14025 [Methylomirabilota bacterium]|nr:hypothetical protein [Methylomirabilota bacterium]
MAEPERLAALKECLETYRSTLEKVNEQLAGPAGAEAGALAEQRQLLRRKIEQAEIEIGFIEDVDGLIARYTERQRVALERARAEQDPARKRVFDERARFCEVVINEALEKKQTVKPLPSGALNEILADLRRAAQEAKDTVASINRAIEIANKVLDGLILLAQVAAKAMI